MFILGQQEQQIGLNTMYRLHKLLVLPIRRPRVRYHVGSRSRLLLGLMYGDHIEEVLQ